MNRLKIFKDLQKQGIWKNSGKALSDKASSGKYYFYERNRSEDLSYYMVKIKGNFIVVTRFKYCYEDGNGVSLFSDLAIPELLGLKPEIPRIIKEIILKHPIREYKSFVKEYKSLTPDLFWEEEVGNRGRYRTWLPNYLSAWHRKHENMITKEEKSDRWIRRYWERECFKKKPDIRFIRLN